MASGLAHELNQPLAAIRNYVHYCRAIVETGRETAVKLPDALDKVDQAATRAAEVIKRIREFVRDRAPMRVATDINVRVQEALGLLEPDLRRALVRVDARLEPDLPAVCGDPVQIEQVFVNLIQNAIDALSGTALEQRVIVLSTRAGAGGDAVHIEVADQGCGVRPDRLPLIFAEFHTSKPEGLGLGLAISSGIAENHGGQLTARANPAGGMILEMTLPAQKGP
jgi:C4-dicarboxylate-specific signal transduction histidine kinase